MEKIERNGKVAVLVSGGFGAGWSTWNGKCAETLCMDAEIVQPVIDGDINKAVEVALRKCPGIYTGGSDGLEVHWVDKGDSFEIEEYDGNESLHIVGSRDYMRA